MQRTFEEWFELFKKYQKDGNVLARFVTPEGAKLGNWVRNIRTGKIKVTPCQKVRLCKYGFVWKVSNRGKYRTFEEWLELFKKYQKDGKVSVRFVTPEGVKLGNWVKHIRLGKIKLKPDQKADLDRAGFDWKISNRGKQRTFEEWFELFKKYQENGYISARFVTPEGARLGEWVQNIKAGKIKTTPEQKDMLEIWKVSNRGKWRTFEEWFELLKKYQENGYISARFVTPEGAKLGNWVCRIRVGRIKLEPYQKDMLDEIHFVWKVPNQKETRTFEEWFELFKKYQKNGFVPTHFVTPEGASLGNWTVRIRNARIKLEPYQKDMLDEIHFAWKGLNRSETRTFEEWFELFKKYQENGSVPEHYVTPEGASLGSWTVKIRNGKIKLDSYQKEMLDEIHFVWNESKRSKQSKHRTFEEWFELLKKYQKNGSVPTSFVTPEGASLGGWILRIRNGKIKLEPYQKEMLDEIHFAWNGSNRDANRTFEEWFELFKKYQKDGTLPVAFVTPDGAKLGSWVARIRSASIRINPYQKAKLDEIGFVWNTKKEKEERNNNLLIV